MQDRISNTDTPVDKKKYDENFDRIFKPSGFPKGIVDAKLYARPLSDFIEGTADDKYRAGYDEAFGEDNG